eukprot:751124_1
MTPSTSKNKTRDYESKREPFNRILSSKCIISGGMCSASASSVIRIRNKTKANLFNQLFEPNGKPSHHTCNGASRSKGECAVSPPDHNYMPTKISRQGLTCSVPIAAILFEMRSSSSSRCNSVNHTY